MTMLRQLPRMQLMTGNRLVSDDIALADGFGSRLRGLLFTDPPPPAFGLLISPCNSVHMLGMRYPIEAVFLSEKWQVLKISSTLHPWKSVASCRKAHAVLEWAPGNAICHNIRVADILSFRTIDAVSAEQRFIGEKK